MHRAIMCKPCKWQCNGLQNFIKKPIPEGFAYQDEEGLRLGMRYTPIERVGVYIPGGQGGLPFFCLYVDCACESCGG